MVTVADPKDDVFPEIIHEREVLKVLGCSRWKLWDLCRNDPDFPKPRMIAGKRSWFVAEIRTTSKLARVGNTPAIQHNRGPQNATPPTEVEGAR